MKKILLILSIALLVISANAQTISPSGNSNYYPYSGFNNDTLRYLKTNFETNKNSYIGKTVKTLLGDLEISVLSSTFQVNSAKEVYELDLRFISNQEDSKRMKNKGKIVTLFITLNQTIPMSEIQALMSKLRETYSNLETNSQDDWEYLHIAFYGGRTIKDIEAFEYDFSKP